MRLELSFPLCNGENKGNLKLSNLSEFAKLVSDRIGIWTLACLALRIVLFLT